MSATVYGYSDDLIEIEGDIVEEFNVTEHDEYSYLAFSNGVVLRIRYEDDGVWRIHPMRSASKVTIEYAHHLADVYSDHAVIEEPISWVVYGDRFETVRP